MNILHYYLQQIVIYTLKKVGAGLTNFNFELSPSVTKLSLIFKKPSSTALDGTGKDLFPSCSFTHG